jgi:site-specific DNA-methyltransferase (adenine-specific)
MADASVDAIVTDPPYGLSFMGKRWDYDVPSVEIWAECLRVLKPGGYLLAFAGTRTQHRMAVRIEDAGFEIRDMIAWVYGSGFPKSHDVSKAIDKAAGAEREAIMVPTKPGNHPDQAGAIALGASGMRDISAPATDAARQWQGWGTALKPALEPITVARKPLIGTVAQNVLAHGTGALNIDGCRVEAPDQDDLARNWDRETTTDFRRGKFIGGTSGGIQNTYSVSPAGRWPANLIHDGSDEVLALFPESGGSGPARTLKRGKRDGDDWGMADQQGQLRDAGTGSAARFFYTAKAGKADRDDGLDHAAERASAASEFRPNHAEKAERGEGGNPYGRWKPQRNHHPTVKPVDLMQYLCRLVTPPGGIVLDPFMGSGSTGRAAVMEGFRFIGIERDPDYAEIARARIANSHGPLFGSQSHD